ncbi:MAG: PHP domain-containing protein [Clostridia bacterium]|nr:PHP domain-containing protein [Clostridia bacterium]
MRVYYDFHIHSCLSPCGDEDMTPNNIVNMSILKGLDIIAVTDHNCAGNVKACQDAAKGTKLTVVGGMEIETSEEIHIVTLFDNTDNLYKFEKIISESLPPLKNKAEIFGEQILMDSDDKFVGFDDRFLITATSLDIITLYKYVSDLGGVVFPAHIDKTSYSIISSLGSIPPELKFSAVEVKKTTEGIIIPDDVLVIHNSDAHYLWDISERENYIDIDSDNAIDILSILHQN